MDIIENISGLASKVAGSNGLDLVDVEVFRAGRRKIVRVFIGRREGVSVDDCAKVSRDLGVLMDAENVLNEEPYTLEVSSPGLDRPFKTLQDYRRNLGRFVRISVSAPVNGKRLVVGKLAEVNEGSIIVDAEGAPQNIPFDLIAQAKVDIRIP